MEPLSGQDDNPAMIIIRADHRSKAGLRCGTLFPVMPGNPVDPALPVIPSRGSPHAFKSINTINYNVFSTGQALSYGHDQKNTPAVL
jgi:hypothetical protein